MVSRQVFGFIVVALIVIQIVFWRLHSTLPSYTKWSFRFLRFQYYLVTGALLLLIGKGADLYLLMPVPYLMVAGIYVGAMWGIVGSIELAILVFAIFAALTGFNIKVFTDWHILARVALTFLTGVVPTYFWYRYLIYRRTLVEYENYLLGVAAKLTSTLDFKTVLSQAFELLNPLVKFEFGLLFTDLNEEVR